MISTESQAKYLACRLTRQSRFGEIEKLIPVYLKSGIEIYPHQIAAAYFAVSNPFSKGFILCDEVGLGKAIEAMLVIAQYYYSGRNKIAVIVPPLLVPQWQRLLSDKFDLPCKVVEKDIEIDDNDEIILISYTQAAEKWESISKIKWDLAVFEEAHRLRKYYTGENRTATNLYKAFDGVQKLLLTATPMQVNVMDLYGLVNFIDNTVFTDERAFYKRYYKKLENYKELRERLMPFTFRTLRNQVRGDVKLPDRVIHTQEYELNEREKTLLPIYYKSTEKIQNELSITAYRIFLSGVDYSACEDLFVLTIDNQHKEQAAVYNRSGGYYFDENIIVTDKDTLYSTHVEFEISYDITTSEKITEISAASIDLILTVTLKDKKVLTFDLGNYLPSSGNITVDNETQSNACNITETDQVDIRYNLSETGTLSDENGVYQYIYRFDIRVGCWVGEGINSVTILQN